MTSWIPASLANHLWQSTLFVAFVWFATLALRRHDARVRYWLWAAASVKFFLPFSWLISLGALLEFRTAPTIAQPAATFVMQEIFAAPLLYTSAPQVPQDTNIGRWIVLGVWLAGTAVVLFWWGRQWRPLRSALRSATPLQLDPAFAEATAGGPDCDASGLTVMSSPSAFEPGIVGILRPVLLMPAGLVDRLTRAQLDAILAHERAHVRAHDNLFAVVHMAVEAIFWFHPLVWWIERRMIDERERACDEAVVRAGKRPADYAEAILTVCRWSLESPVMCVSGVTGSDLRTRVEAILANRLGRRLHLTGRLLLAGAALIVLGGPVGIGLLAAAQGRTVAKPQIEVPGATERFDVVTIRQNKGPAVGGPIGGGIGFRPGRFSAENITLQQILTSAYELQAYEIFGGPDWVTSDRFDIAATMPPSPTVLDDLNARARNRRLIRALLAERFTLVVHEERREMPVYSLVMAKSDRKLGQRLRPFEGECGEPGKLGPPPNATFGMPTSDPSKGPQWCMAFTGMGRLSAQGTTLSDLTMLLARLPAVRRRVLDRTGLTGRFDFDLEWTPFVPPGVATPDRPSPETGPTIFTALQEQLGLRLVSTKETMPVLVIDSVNQPSPN